MRPIKYSSKKMFKDRFIVKHDNNRQGKFSHNKNMQRFFNKDLAMSYKSPSQKIRVLTESWVNNEIFCPSCGGNIAKYPNNQPVADFGCTNCKEEYELKSKHNGIGSKVLDGAYRTMIERLLGSNNPNFFLLNYGLQRLEVLNFLVIPKYFFVPESIEKRKPLSPTARRAGWIGCNILLNHIPQTGKIFFIREGQIEPKEDVLSEWKKTLFLREEKEINARGWLLDVLSCVEKLGSKEFSLDEMYKFENELSNKHPENHHIKDKIRQQLQILRNNSYLDFLGRGKYRLI